MAGRTDWVSRLRGLASIRADSWGEAMAKVALLPVIAFFMSAADVVGAIANTVIRPLEGMANGLYDFVLVLLGGPAELLQAGVEVSSQGLEPFGFVAFLVSVGLVLVAGFMVAKYLKEEETSDLIPFSFTDIPFLGSREEGGD